MHEKIAARFRRRLQRLRVADVCVSNTTGHLLAGSRALIGKQGGPVTGGGGGMQCSCQPPSAAAEQLRVLLRRVSHAR
jgi:hypothetical protein